MTIPYMMNCSHTGDGWCISCVKELGEKNKRLEKLLIEGFDYVDQLEGLAANVAPTLYKAAATWRMRVLSEMEKL